MKSTFTIFVLSLLPAFGFADEEIDPAPRQKNLGPRLPWEREFRAAPSKPRVMEEGAIKKHMALKEMDADVLAIQCSLGQFNTPCRGVEISLSDAAGSEVTRAHTGTNGFVGFEGLPKRTEYFARIVSDKYQGELEVHPGHIFVMNGQWK